MEVDYLITDYPLRAMEVRELYRSLSFKATYNIADDDTLRNVEIE